MSSEQQQPAQRFCPDCVKPVAPDATSCPLCGKQLSVVDLADEFEKRSNKRAWYNRPYGCALIVFGLLFVGGLLNGNHPIEAALWAFIPAGIWFVLLGLFYWPKDRGAKETPTDR